MLQRRSWSRLGRLSWALLAVVLAGTCTAAKVPRNDGWVTDLGGFLSAEEERSLEQLLESYHRAGSAEVALLTLPDLGGQSLERLALETSREWGLGRKGKNDGLLILLTRKEKKIRIEVGRGLEGQVTDSIAGRIIRDVMAPELRQGRNHAGLRAGLIAVHELAEGRLSPALANAKPRQERQSEPLASFVIPLLLFLIFWLAVSGRVSGNKANLLWFLFSVLRGSGGGSSRWGGGGGGGGGFGGFGGGGGFSGGGASGGW